MDFEGIQKRLCYKFRDLSLLKQAFTHNSFSADNYQRLEFLGDAVLQLSVSEFLMSVFPEASEGELSQMRSQLVRGEHLADLLLSCELEGHIRKGKSLSGIRNKKAVLADVFEAILGAMYLDGGYQAANDFVRQQFSPSISRLESSGVEKDAKTRLQELLQKHAKPLPVYTLLAEPSAENSQFKICCEVSAFSLDVIHEANTRKQAEQQGAEIMLEKLRGKLNG